MWAKRCYPPSPKRVSEWRLCDLQGLDGEQAEFPQDGRCGPCPLPFKRGCTEILCFGHLHPAHTCFPDQRFRHQRRPGPLRVHGPNPGRNTRTHHAGHGDGLWSSRTAFEQVYTETATAQEALTGANEELISIVDGLQRADAPPANRGYRTVSVNFTTDGSSTYSVLVDGELHSRLVQSTFSGEALPPIHPAQLTAKKWLNETANASFRGAALVECDLTGMVPTCFTRSWFKATRPSSLRPV